MKEKSTKIKYVAQCGIEGKDDFMLKFSDGRVYPWPSKEELDELEKKYPMPTAEQMEEYYRLNPGIKEKMEIIKQIHQEKNLLSNRNKGKSFTINNSNEQSNT